LVVVAAAWWALTKQERQRRRMRRLARDLGAMFERGDRRNLRDRHADLAMWQYGHTHEISDVLKGFSSGHLYECFTDTFDVGFGRERARRMHVGLVADVDQAWPEVVCIREGQFTPCGPHVHYEPVGGDEIGAEGTETEGWQIWCRPGEDATAVWRQLQGMCSRLAGPCLVETRGETLAICRPGRNDPSEYRGVIKVGLEMARLLGGKT
jgi:hypothetical protein